MKLTKLVASIMIHIIPGYGSRTSLYLFIYFLEYDIYVSEWRRYKHVMEPDFLGRNGRRPREGDVFWVRSQLGPTTGTSCYIFSLEDLWHSETSCYVLSRCNGFLTENDNEKFCRHYSYQDEDVDGWRKLTLWQALGLLKCMFSGYRTPNKESEVGNLLLKSAMFFRVSILIGNLT